MTRLAMLLFALTPILASTDIGGTWHFNIVSFGEEVAPAKLELKLEGEKLTG